MRNIIALAALALAFFAAPAFAQDEPPPPEPPAGWTCDPTFFGTDDGCDCGCGVADADCADNAVATCEFNQCEADTDVPTAADPSQCAANTCGDGYVGGDEACDAGVVAGCAADCTAVTDGFACGRNASGCHAIVCGDGIVDFTFDPKTFEPIGEECDDGDAEAGDGCSDACALEDGFVCREDGQPCVELPAGWTCSGSFFGGGELDGCDCGCGAEDPDCNGGGCIEANCDDAGEICEFCHDVDGAIVPCGEPAEGEGEGEGEGPGGEGEGEGEGEDDGPFGADPDVDDDEGGGGGCASTATSTSAAAGLLLLALLRRRR